MKKSFIKVFTGILIGLVNSVLGAGGGMIAVPALKKYGMSQTKAQASAIAIILPLSIISAVCYIFNGNVKISDSLIYLLPGVAGAVTGAIILPKIPIKILKKIFAGFMIWAGIRLLIK